MERQPIVIEKDGNILTFEGGHGTISYFPAGAHNDSRLEVSYNDKNELGIRMRDLDINGLTVAEGYVLDFIDAPGVKMSRELRAYGATIRNGISVPYSEIKKINMCFARTKFFDARHADVYNEYGHSAIAAVGAEMERFDIHDARLNDSLLLEGVKIPEIDISNVEIRFLRLTADCMQKRMHLDLRGTKVEEFCGGFNPVKDLTFQTDESTRIPEVMMKKLSARGREA